MGINCSLLSPAIPASSASRHLHATPTHVLSPSRTPSLPPPAVASRAPSLAPYAHSSFRPNYRPNQPPHSQPPLLQNDIVLGKRLGTGGFGTVFKGELKEEGGVKTSIIIKKVGRVWLVAWRGVLSRKGQNQLKCVAALQGRTQWV